MSNYSIIILSRDRHLLLEECIYSILSQSDSFDEIIVSDNSINTKEIFQLEKKYNSKIHFIYRGGKLDMFEHFRTNFINSNSDYLTLIHDDDILHKDYLKTIKNFVSNYPNFGLVGTNGIYFNDKYSDKILKKRDNIFKIKKNINTYLKINSKILLSRYLDYDMGGVAPFSTYMYNLNQYKGVDIPLPSLSRCRYVDDAFFLIDSASKIELFWINKKLSLVRRHDKSATLISLLDYRLFISNIIKHDSFDKSLKLKIFKYRFFSFLSNRRKISIKNIFLYIKIFYFLIIYSSYFRALVLRKFFK